ncbi:MAG: YlxR family protein [Candidatus Cloacimonetes bacterium]|nr:YlxR family protein [Candidatus Cloacimonadota bacterium]
MPNKASKKSHVPFRTCVICKEKTSQSSMHRFVIQDGKILFDEKKNLEGRGYYFCDKEKCKASLSSWIKKAKKK